MTRIFLLALLVASSAAAQTQRLVTAGSAVTETVCALGHCSDIVGTDKTSLFPEEVKALPSIGYRTGITAEGIISLKPTLFIAEKGYVDEAVVKQVRSTGIRVVEIERTYSVDGTKILIRTIATAINESSKGEKLIAEIVNQLASVAQLVKTSQKPRVLCIYNRGTQSFDAAGENTFANILPLVNATPAITGIVGYKPLNTEALIASNPDFLLMFESGVASLGGKEGVLRVPGIKQTTAGKNSRVLSMEGAKLSNFGPRLGEAVKELATMLYGTGE